MRVGILGSGLMGGELGTIFALDMKSCSATRGTNYNSRGCCETLRATRAPAWRCHE
jgi:hypothetical protein